MSIFISFPNARQLLAQEVCFYGLEKGGVPFAITACWGVWVDFSPHLHLQMGPLENLPMNFLLKSTRLKMAYKSGTSSIIAFFYLCFFM